MRLLKSRESGQALIMVILLMGFGSLMMVPTLNLAGTSLRYHQVVEKNVLETYAADCGMGYALCKLGNNPAEYRETPLEEGFTVNNRTVNVTLEYLDNNIYKITSTATSDDGSSTTIESYLSISGDFSFLLDNAITSPGDITIKPGTEVVGDIQYDGVLDNKGTIIGEIINGSVSWPTAEEFSAIYSNDVDGLTPVPDGYTIDISSGTLAAPYPIGPLYAAGNLTITGSGVAKLDGIVYVAGNLVIMPNCTILLNMQTIYVEGSIDFQPGCTTSGSGCVIAVGNVDYQPNISGDDYVLLMSIAGTVTLKPGNSFYGSVAGNAEVELMPGTTLEYVEPTDGLNFPGAGGSDISASGLQIITWQISG